MIFESRCPRVLAVIFLAALALAGCSSSPKPVLIPSSDGNTLTLPPGVTYKVGRPYTIAGVWYYPAENYTYSEVGIASWYGPNFHGKKTANGEIFDMNALTAAHPTLPLPSIVRVTNLKNGRVLRLRINDRGPFKNNRIIDVSRRAAELLGFKNEGITRVRVEIEPDESLYIKNIALGRNPGPMPTVKAAPRTAVASADLPPPRPTTRAAPPTARPPVPEPETVQIPMAPKPVSAGEVEPAMNAAPIENFPEQLFVQAGAFSDESNARRLAYQLEDFGEAFVVPVIVDGDQFYRVRLGPIDTQDQADDLREEVASYGYTDAQVVRN